MVIKGGARAEADKLAAHLLRVDTNERVDVREILGVCGPDLAAALREMEAIASAARSRRPFYHASINTAPNELMTDAQKARAIDRLEQELGLTGQPRIVVEHVKDGREHLHVAWSRIDGETMRAIPDSHNYRRHEIVARELEREFEHARVQGAHVERDGVERPARCPSHAETRQAERSGVSPEEAKAQLRELWQSADNGQAFAAALDAAGWTLAQGDRRGFVALDPAGEVRAVNKAITGLSAAGVRERLADLDPEQLPTVDQAREQRRARQQQPEPAPAPEFDHAAGEPARPEAMAQEFDSRDHGGDAAPGFELVQEDYGHGLDDSRDLAHEREAGAEAPARADDAAMDAELARMSREIAEAEAALAELDAITEAVRDQFRQQREALDAAEWQMILDAARAREAQQRGDDSAVHARHAMEDLARTDPLGTERNFGHHAGDRLKSPEEMRREWADLMRGGSAERAAEHAAAWEKMEARAANPSPAGARDSAAPDPAPKVSPQPGQAGAPSRDPVAERAAWAERLRGFDRPDPAAEREAWAARLRGFASESAREAVHGATPEAAREAEPDRTRDRKHQPEASPEVPEHERGGLFHRLREKARQWFKPAAQPEPLRDGAADRRHDAAGDRQEEHVRPPPAQQPVREPARPRPAQRVRDVAAEILARGEARFQAERAAETPEQRQDRERLEREAEQSRGRGDGSRERTRYHHSPLWVLFYSFQYRHDMRRRHRQP
jgi:hypothetical protein